MMITSVLITTATHSLQLQEICQSRIAQVLQFRQQADALDAAASALEQHITTCADQVRDDESCSLCQWELLMHGLCACL